MANRECTLIKGAYTVIIYASQIEDGYANKLKIITPGTGKQSQDLGPKDNKVVDLLRLTRTFRIMGYILSNTVKSDLIKIIEGGGVKGGGITFAYPDGGDATSFTVYAESCIITQKSSDFGYGWIASAVYKAGDVVEYNGTFYRCLADVTSATDPATDTTNWSSVGTDDFAKFDVNITLIKSE